MRTAMYAVYTSLGVTVPGTYMTQYTSVVLNVQPAERQFHHMESKGTESRSPHHECKYVVIYVAWVEDDHLKN